MYLPNAQIISSYVCSVSPFSFAFYRSISLDVLETTNCAKIRNWIKFQARNIADTQNRRKSKEKKQTTWYCDTIWFSVVLFCFIFHWFTVAAKGYRIFCSFQCACRHRRHYRHHRYSIFSVPKVLCVRPTVFLQPCKINNNIQYTNR